MRESRVQTVVLDSIKNSGVTLYMKREDEIHPFISGNKYRKLKYNLLEAKEKGASTLLSFGGAYSNHISALAYAGQKYGFQTIGVIRGEELGVDLEKTLKNNYTLKQAYQNGMRFKFMSRAQYRDKQDSALINRLKAEFGDFYMVPEGGTNEFAIKGCEEILMAEDKKYDIICTAVGTGGTIAGLINSASEGQEILGFPSLKGEFLEGEIKKYIKPKNNWNLIHDYHFGGYAKINEILISFINDFYRQTTIPLDPVYTGKMMFGIMDMINNNYFKQKCKILAIHTGGLQGINGMNERLLKKNLPLIDV
jgi:1-aminocyclopropane-1-carboxylate deaminase